VRPPSKSILMNEPWILGGAFLAAFFVMGAPAGAAPQ
jgi:hypothetical protein